MGRLNASNSLSVFICLYLSVFLNGQNAPSFAHLTVGDGLAHNTVHSILQDNDGFFWIGTRRGLNRYDGSNFRTFTSRDPENPLAGPTVLSLLEDKRGRIWAGHRNAGISIYDKATGTITPFALGEEGNTPVNWSTIGVRALFRDRRGRTWIGTLGGGVVVLHPDGTLLHHFATYAGTDFNQRISSDFVFDFVEDETGAVYVATSGRGLNRVWLEQRRWEILNAPDDKNLDSFEKALLRTQDGHIWIGTAGSGLYRFQPNTSDWFRYDAPAVISHPLVTDLIELPDGRLWLATDGGGLNVLDPTNGAVTVLRYTPDRATSLNTDALYKLMRDRAGNLWVGTFNGGLNVFRQRQPPYLTDRRYEAEKKAGLRSVLCVTEDQAGTTWLGTDGGGLFRFRQNRSQINSIATNKGASAQVQSGKIDGVITALAPVNDGLWFGSYAGGLGYLNLTTGGVTKYRHNDLIPSSLAHNNVWDLAVDADGGVWAGLLGGGVDYLAPGTNTFTHFTPRSGDTSSLTGRQVIDILLDRNGRYLWVATENAGLNRLDINTNEVQRFRHDPEDDGSVSDDRLRHLHQTVDGTLWIGTENHGLNALEQGANTFQRYNSATGYPFELVNGITVDSAGFFWISSLTEITRWDRTNNRLLTLPNEEELGYNLYNPGAIIHLSNGHLVFGGVNGFSIIDPTGLDASPPPPEVLISEVRLANELITPGDFNGRTILTGAPNAPSTQVQLSYQDRGISFRFAAPAYADPTAVRFSFRLAGFDSDWVETPPGAQTAYYSSLKGGTYQLYVRARGPNGEWGATRPPLTITVAPPFYRTTWFIVMVAALLCLMVYLLNRYLLNRQREAYRREAMQREQEILKLKNRNLKEEVAAKQSELGASLLQMAHKNEFLNDLKLKIKQLNTTASEPQGKPLRAVVRVIDHELKQEDYWEQFQLIFDQGYQDFVARLLLQHPELSNNDCRLCCFIRMSLNNREIANVLNITLNGVEQAKYRLKKKLALPKAQRLNDYVRKFG